MQCEHCGFAIGEDDHRCQRCGRRLSGVVIAAPPGYSGANALAIAPVADTLDTQEFLLAKAAAAAASGPVPVTTSPEPPLQASLFGTPQPAGRKVIQFDRWQRQQPWAAAVTAPPIHRPAQRPAKKHTPGKSTVEQATLDFVPAPPSKTRRLKTEVDAQIFCDQPVATTTHRFVASSIDAAMITIGFGLIVVIVQAMGGSFGNGKQFWTSLAATFALVALFYGLVWSIAGRETVGMRSTDLHLITFDGFPVDAQSRALRVLSTWLSFLSAGLGLLWSLADEENLTWHDHISKTFPTVREAPRSFVKARR